MNYSISELPNKIQILEVKKLANEYDNREILADFEARIDKGFRKFVVDLGNLDFMNSLGISFLISVMTKSKNSGSNFAVANASDQAIKVLEITKLKRHFNLFPSLEEAVKIVGA